VFGFCVQVEKDGAFERGENTRPVHVTGTQEQVDLAEKLILETVSQPSFREAEGIEEDNIDVSNTKVSLFTSHQGLFTPHQDLFTPHKGLFTPRQGVFTPRQGLFTPHQSLFTPH
jgi:hypothetical protein